MALLKDLTVHQIRSDGSYLPECSAGDNIVKLRSGFLGFIWQCRRGGVKHCRLSPSPCARACHLTAVIIMHVIYSLAPAYSSLISKCQTLGAKEFKCFPLAAGRGGHMANTRLLLRDQKRTFMCSSNGRRDFTNTEHAGTHKHTHTRIENLGKSLLPHTRGKKQKYDRASDLGLLKTHSRLDVWMFFRKDLDVLRACHSHDIYWPFEFSGISASVATKWQLTQFT